MAAPTFFVPSATLLPTTLAPLAVAEAAFFVPCQVVSLIRHYAFYWLFRRFFSKFATKLIK